jgi:FeS assembly SUF system protein
MNNEETKQQEDKGNTQEQSGATVQSREDIPDNGSILADNGMSLKEIYDEVVKVLKTCYDPEIPVDVYELGLIYDIKIAVNRDVLVVMTLTSPSCPVAGTLPKEIEDKIKEHPLVNDAKIQLTFDPPWEMSLMTEEAKLELGFL